MLFKVTKQYARGTDTLIAQFNDEKDARLFIQTKLSEDARFKVKATYRLMEGMEILEEMSDADGSSSSTSSSSGGGGAGQRSSFQPTPFNAAPRPAGMPHNWVKDDNKEEDK